MIPTLLGGLLVTLQLTVVSVGGGVLAGLGLALLVGSRRWYVSAPAVVLVEVGRGAPAIVVLQLVYFGLPNAGIVLNAMPAAWLALGFTTAAYSSEIIRAGVLAVPHGQWEAARALGLARRHTLWGVVLPQAARVALAPVLSLAVQMFQATSLAWVLSVPELLSRAYGYGTITFRYLEVLSAAGLLYAVVAVPVVRAAARLERRASQGYRVVAR